MKGQLISYINIYHLIRFLSSSCQLEFSSLEVKYDRFRIWDEGTWQKPLEILSTKDNWSEHLKHIKDALQSEEASRWKGINTHKHKHTHTHTSIWIISKYWLDFFKTGALKKGIQSSLRSRQNSCKTYAKEFIFITVRGLHLGSLPKNVTHL